MQSSLVLTVNFQYSVFICINDDASQRDEDKGMGSCFLYKRDSNYFLITANHIFKNLRDIQKIKILKNNQIIEIPVEEVIRDTDRDILIFKTSQIHPYEVSGNYEIGGWDDVVLGQEFMFLGFPYGLQQKFPDYVST